MIEWTLLRLSLWPEALAPACLLVHRSRSWLGNGRKQGLFLLCSSKTVAVVLPVCLLRNGLSVALVSASLAPHAWYAAASLEGPDFPFLKRNLSSADFLFCFPLYAIVFYSPGPLLFFSTLDFLKILCKFAFFWGHISFVS